MIKELLEVKDCKLIHSYSGVRTHDLYSGFLPIDKRNLQLKFKIWDVNKQFETDAKVMGSNLVICILFFIDNNVTNYICYLLVIYYHCWDKNNPK